MRRCFSQLALFGQQQTKLVMPLEVVRIELGGLSILAERLFPAPQREQDASETNSKRIVPGQKFDRGLVLFQGEVGLAHDFISHPQGRSSVAELWCEGNRIT